MGRIGYGTDVKLQAKAMWIAGQKSDVQIAEELGITQPGTISDWRKEGAWEHEREIFQRITEQRIAEAVSETISEMNSRHLKEFQLLQSKGVQGLKQYDPKTAQEAAAMIESGVRGERLVRGEPTEVREVRALMQANVQVLELVVADVLKLLLEAGQIDRLAARKFAEMFAEKVNSAPFRFAVEG